MKRAVLATTLALVLAAPGSASASLADDYGAGLTTIYEPCPTPPPSYAPLSGCAWWEDQVIYINPAAVAKPFIWAHEVGHIFDHDELTDDERFDIAVAFDWEVFPPSGSERFANAFATCFAPRPAVRRMRSLTFTTPHYRRAGCLAIRAAA